ncbi:WSC domain-containing protein 1 [Branchiostoma belcheri]|nr:WSC domain-containing protein 1 [Branchiostoma belcheri]
MVLLLTVKMQRALRRIGTRVRTLLLFGIIFMGILVFQVVSWKPDSDLSAPLAVPRRTGDGEAGPGRASHRPAPGAVPGRQGSSPGAAEDEVVWGEGPRETGKVFSAIRKSEQAESLPLQTSPLAETSGKSNATVLPLVNTVFLLGMNGFTGGSLMDEGSAGRVCGVRLEALPTALEAPVGSKYMCVWGDADPQSKLSYMGCYEDNVLPNRRALQDDFFADYRRMTIEKCLAHCRRNVIAGQAEVEPTRGWIDRRVKYHVHSRGFTGTGGKGSINYEKFCPMRYEVVTSSRLACPRSNSPADPESVQPTPALNLPPHSTDHSATSSPCKHWKHLFSPSAREEDHLGTLSPHTLVLIQSRLVFRPRGSIVLMMREAVGHIWLIAFLSEIASGVAVLSGQAKVKRWGEV